MKYGIALRLAIGLLAGALGGRPAMTPALAQDAGTSTTEERRPVSMEGLTSASELLNGFDLLGITGLAGELGFEINVFIAEGEYPSFLLKDENGAPMILRPMVCTGTEFSDRCDALLVFAMFGKSTAYPGLHVEQINQYNDQQFYGRGHLTADGLGIVSRFLIAEYGITRGSVAIELTTFRRALYSFARFMSEDRFAASGMTSFKARPPTSSLLPGRSAGPAGVPASVRGGTSDLVDFVSRTGLKDDFIFPAHILDTGDFDGGNSKADSVLKFERPLHLE